ncbi:MAG TPA: lysophospholipid acyltransferase family protein [Thermoanaerobaculia bacterium]|nr:lysophospholipid acyltransferase family protein [Thermoanaerobaculia bacterium]
MTRTTGAKSSRRRTRGKSRKPFPVVWIEYALFRIVVAAFRRASDSRLDRWSERVARVAPRLICSRHRLAIANLRRVFPEMSAQEADRIARACWKHYAHSVFQYLHTIDEPIDDIAGRFDLDPRYEEVEGVLRNGKGCIIVTAHFGSWEFAISLLTRIEADISVVARRLDNPLLDRRLNEARLRSGVRILDRRRAARAIYRTLEKGGLVGMVADQAVKPREGLLVPFLGRPAWTTNAPARLALRFGAPIYCIFSIPEGDRFRLVIEPAIRVEDLPPEERTEGAITERMNDLLSERIRRQPELWLWMHNRWKGAP